MKAKAVVGINWTGHPMGEGDVYRVERDEEVEEPVKVQWRKGEDPITRMRKYHPDRYAEFVRKRTEAIRATWEKRRAEKAAGKREKLK